MSALEDRLKDLHLERAAQLSRAATLAYEIRELEELLAELEVKKCTSV